MNNHIGKEQRRFEEKNYIFAIFILTNDFSVSSRSSFHFKTKKMSNQKRKLILLLVLTLACEYINKSQAIYMFMPDVLQQRKYDLIQNKLIPSAVRYGEVLLNDENVSLQYKDEYFKALDELLKQSRKKKRSCKLFFLSWCNNAEEE